MSSQRKCNVQIDLRPRFRRFRPRFRKETEKLRAESNTNNEMLNYDVALKSLSMLDEVIAAGKKWQAIEKLMDEWEKKLAKKARPALRSDDVK